MLTYILNRAAQILHWIPYRRTRRWLDGSLSTPLQNATVTFKVNSNSSCFIGYFIVLIPFYFYYLFFWYLHILLLFLTAFAFLRMQMPKYPNNSIHPQRWTRKKHRRGGSNDWRARKNSMPVKWLWSIYIILHRVYGPGASLSMVL